MNAGTTGPQGGDWGHGSRAYVSLEDESSTAWAIRIDGKIFEPNKIEILIGGDSELGTLKSALKFAVKNI